MASKIEAEREYTNAVNYLRGARRNFTIVYDAFARVCAVRDVDAARIHRKSVADEAAKVRSAYARLVAAKDAFIAWMDSAGKSAPKFDLKDVPEAKKPEFRAVMPHGHAEVTDDKDVVDALNAMRDAAKAGDEKAFKAAYERGIEAADRVWKPQTDEEKKTAAAMATIKAVHTVRPIDGIKETNPNYSSGEEYRINCQRCSPSWEIAARGYQVVAKPKPDGKDPIYDGMTSRSAEWFFPTYVSPHPIRYRRRSDIEKKMAKWGDGARAQIICTWKGDGAHTFQAKQENGKTVFVDAQTGKSGVDIDWYWGEIDFETRRWQDYNVFFRTDNAEFTPASIAKICSVK